MQYIEGNYPLFYQFKLKNNTPPSTIACRACQNKCSKPLKWFAAYRSRGLPQTTLEIAGE
nr:MAG TPA: hypothetical protein [Caudoviricetes sp.]